VGFIEHKDIVTILFFLFYKRDEYVGTVVFLCCLQVEISRLPVLGPNIGFPTSRLVNGHKFTLNLLHINKIVPKKL